jgi:protoheme IX farnesyltransferase
MIAGSMIRGEMLVQKAIAYAELLKVRLSLLVAISCAFGYILASAEIDFMRLALVFTGGFLLSGASVVVNQILERDYDKLMNRTQNRPLPSGRVTVEEAWIFSGIIMLVSFGLLFISTNFLTLVLSCISMLLYTMVYTPLKRVGAIAVLVGAVPGALPPLLGWTAVRGEITYEALIIFGIQFIWQFPHFWAIAWVADEDYKRAGFKLLPFGGKKDLNTAIQIMIYTLFLLPLGLLPAKFGITGINSAIVATVCGVLFLSQTFSLMKDESRKSALRIMFASFIYLPVVQLAYLLDKV